MHPLQMLHPFAAFIHAHDSGYAAAPSVFITSVMATQILAWLLFGIASWRVSRSWQTRPALGRWLRWQEWRRNLVQGNAPDRLKRRRRLLNVNPLLWLQSRERVMRLALTVATLLLAAGCLWINFERAFHWRDIGAAMACMIFLHVLVLMLLAFEAGCQFVEARREGGLELVLATRLSVREILRGHFLTTLRVFAPTLTIVFVYDLLWVLFAAAHARPGNAGLALAFGACMAITLAVDAGALAWCAFYRGLRARRPVHAAMRGFAEIVLAPLLWFGLVLAGGVQQGSPALALAFFAALNLVNAWIFGTGAHQRLHEEFRQSITEHLPSRTKDYDADYALLK